MTDGVGFVIQGNAPINQPALEKAVKAVDSPNTSHTVLNNPGLAEHLKANVAPKSHFYLRHYDSNGDADDWKQYSPESYFAKYAGDVKGKGLGLQFCNEPGFDTNITTKMLPFMLEAERRNIPISMGGFSVGTLPDNSFGWAAHDGFVSQLCRRPDLFVLDGHEYGLVTPTSGMVRKDTQPGEVLYFVHKMLKEQDWPKTFDEVMNAYHIGRLKHFFTYAKSRGYGKPTVDAGEGCIDFVSDVAAIDAWGKGLPSTNPVKLIGHVRGYKSMGQAWPQLVAPGQTVQQTYMDIILWVRRMVYDAIGVRSMRLFTWGNSGNPGTVEDWNDFDFNNDPDMQKEFLDRIQTVNVPASQVPLPVPTPAPAQPSIPPAPETPVISPPNVTDYEFNFIGKVSTTSPEAAHLIAIWATQLLNIQWDAFKQATELMKLMDKIDSVSFEVK